MGKVLLCILCELGKELLTCASVRVLVQLRVMFGDVVLELVTSMDVDTGGRLPSRWFVYN